MTEITFDERGLVPVIVQEADTQEVLMLAWMNADAIQMTFDKGLVTFWSRSRQELWTKGETSGNQLELVELRYDCDSDALLARAKLHGTGVCHTGERTCFFRTVDAGPQPPTSSGARTSAGDA